MTCLLAPGGTAAAGPDLEVRSDQPELTVGRTRYHLLTKAGPARLRLRGPGTLTVQVRVNLPPTGQELPPPVVLGLMRLGGAAEEEVARWTVSEAPDEGQAYAETERYRPSEEAQLFAELPPGEAVLSLVLASDVPFGAVFAARFFPKLPEVEEEDEPGAGREGPALDDEGRQPAPPARAGLVPRLGLAVPLVASGGLVALAGLSVRLPLGDAWRLDVSADALVHGMEGTAPAGAGVGPASNVALAYDAVPLRLGVQWRWPLPGAQPFGGLGGGVTLGRERISALRGALDDEQTFLLLAVEARAGLEWAPSPETGPLVVAVHALLHPVQVVGATYGEPVPVSFVALEVGYHVAF